MPTPTATNQPGSTHHGTHQDTHNDQDVSFAQDMVVHHRGAIQMSALAATRASSSQVKVLAKSIAAAQQPQVDAMSSWLRVWGVPVPQGDSMASMGSMGPSGSMGSMGPSGSMGSGSVPGMMSKASMDRLEASAGPAFDRLFLQLMIVHHQGVLTMSQAEEKAGSSTQALALARSIRTSQTRQIALMKRMLSALG